MIHLAMNDVTKSNRPDNQFNISTRINAYCQLMGFRRVSKRLHIAELVESNNGYVDAVAIWVSLRNANIKISQGAVYHALHWLTKNGFIECISSNEDKTINKYRILSDDS